MIPIRKTAKRNLAHHIGLYAQNAKQHTIEQNKTTQINTKEHIAIRYKAAQHNIHNSLLCISYMHAWEEYYT